jgi:hypothetical protein
VRETVQNLKKRGEPLASDMSKNLGLLTAHLFTMLRLPAALLGLFGLRLETQVECLLIICLVKKVVCLRNHLFSIVGRMFTSSVVGRMLTKLPV